MSPYSNYALYRYHIESSMAFGSGFTVVKILPADEECDYTDRDFFRFGNYYPFLIKWKSEDTLLVICLVEGGLADRQPVRRDILKWKDWTFEVEYYSMFSTVTNGSYRIDNYNVSSSSVDFKSDTSSFVFDNKDISLELDSNQISLRQFKIDTFDSKTGVSLSEYKFDLNTNYGMKDFDRLQPFITTKQ